MKMNRLTTWIGCALVLGVIVGYACNTLAASPAQAKEIASYFSILTDIFLRLIKMIIAPLVFATLVAGLAGMGDARSVGRIGSRALGWFIGASFCSLFIGLIFANVLHPGHALNVPLPESAAGLNLKTGALNLKDFITHVFPKSIIEAMAGNEVLQILVFALFFGLALGHLHSQTARSLVNTMDEVVHVMLKVTDYVMRFAPFGVFGRRHHHQWPGHAGDFWQIHAEFLCGAGGAVAGADWRWLSGAGPRCVPFAQAGARPAAGGVFHRLQRVGVPQADGAAGKIWCQNPRDGLCAAAGLFV